MINFSNSSYNSYPALNRYSQKTNLYTQEKEQKQKIKEKQYNDIYEHELAHKNAAGSLGGSIVIENNSEGIPVGGHVDIKMPVLDKKNPDKTIKHADTVIKSAMAPHDPSNQDYKVASEARSIKSQALNEKNEPEDFHEKIGKSLNFMA